MGERGRSAKSYRRNAAPSAACGECYRRKQKCDKTWPCQHCSKRRIPHLCQFASAGGNVKRVGSVTEKRGGSNQESRNRTQTTFDVLREMGFSQRRLVRLGLADESALRTSARVEYISWDSLCDLVSEVPHRAVSDQLMQVFVDKVQFHCYLMPAPVLFDKYNQWREAQGGAQVMELHWACLLLEIFACSAQQISNDPDAGRDYHEASERLSQRIDAHQPCLSVLQRMLYHCFWLKSGGQLKECRQSLSAAFQEGLKQGLHEEPGQVHHPDMEQGQRQEIMVILEMWDWELSTILGLPSLVQWPVLSAPPLTIPRYFRKRQITSYLRLAQRLLRGVRCRELTVAAWEAQLPEYFRVPMAGDIQTCSWLRWQGYHLQLMKLSFLADHQEHNSTDPNRSQKAKREALASLLDLTSAFLSYCQDTDTRADFLYFYLIDALLKLNSVLKGESQYRDTMLDKCTAVSSLLGRKSSKIAADMDWILKELTPEMFVEEANDSCESSFFADAWLNDTTPFPNQTVVGSEGRDELWGLDIDHRAIDG